MTATDPGPTTLAELEARLQRDFALLVMPPNKDWLEPRAHPQYGPALDVAVIGAGMSGLAAAFAYERTRMLAAPMAVHAIYNAAVLGFQLNVMQPS